MGRPKIRYIENPEDSKFCTFCETTHPLTKEFWIFDSKEHVFCKKRMAQRHKKAYRKRRPGYNEKYQVVTDETTNESVKLRYCHYCKEYHLNNDEYWYYNKKNAGECRKKVRERKHANYLKNIEDITKKNKIYVQQNREKVTKKKVEWELTKRKVDINFKLAKVLRSRARAAMRGEKMPASAVRDLGCSIVFFISYLESKFYSNTETGEMMTWDNHGYYGWHIDHITPLISFNLSDREQFLKACHYSNLQPLWMTENLKKGDKINGTE